MAQSFCIVLLSLMESIQAILLLGWVVNACPPLRNSFGEIGFYFIFCTLSITAGIMMGRWALARQQAKDFWPKLWRFCIIEGILTFLILSALFKTIVYDHQPQLAQMAYQVLLLAALLHKIFWMKVLDFFKACYALMMREGNVPILIRLADLFFPLFILILILVPDAEAVVARMFIGEQFHHWESSVLAAGWAFTAGSVLDVDVISRYGLGMPMIVAQLTKLFGGYSIVNVFLVMMWMCIVYYILCYVLLRLWLKDICVAIAGIFFGIKVQMFHWESLPFCFTYPSATILRYCFDILVLFLIFFHLQNPRKIFLLMAGAICGLAIFHITPEGVYLTTAFYFYVVARLCLGFDRDSLYRSLKDLPYVVSLFLSAPLSMLALMRLTQGVHFWDREFWVNAFEFLSYHTSGLAMSPIYQSLQDHNFLASLMGFLFPLVYVLTMLIVSSLCFFRKIGINHLFAAVVAVYGLGLYHYYVGMSVNTAYYASGLPFVFLLCYWINILLKRVSISTRRHVGIILVVVTAYSLLTNHLFVSYPNALCVSRNPLLDPAIIQIPPGRVSYFNHLFREYPDAFKMPLNSLGERAEDLRMEKDFISSEELKAYFRQEMDFKEDAALIDQLTAPHEPVPLISSFEIKMLMQANRKPFFFYFPMVNSRPLRMRMFVVPNYFTVDATKRTIDQLVNSKPKFVFMEAIFMNRNVPQAYYHDSQGLMEVLDYVNDHYEPVARGKFLVAMKLKG